MLHLHARHTAAGVPSGNFGPRLQAIVAVCSGAYRMSKRGVEELVEDFFGVPISLGSVANLEQATSKAVEVPVEEVARAIREEPIVHADETGWFEGSKRAWLWVAITAHLAFFLVRTSRGAKVAKELLGAAFAGILVSDRWSAYSWVDVARRQLCWAHLLRQFRGFQDHGPEASAIGQPLELLTETMFHAWHRVRDGTMTRADFQKLMTPLRQYVVLHLNAGLSCPTQSVAGRCREILTLEPALWTFVDVEGVEPTNNAAEHGVSPPAGEGPTFSGIAGTQGPTRWRGGGSSRSLPRPEGARGQGARDRRRSGVSDPLR